MLVSGAEGTYHLKLATSTTAVIAAELVAGQTATIRGQTDGIVWTYTGAGAAFQVGANAELQIDSVAVAAASSLAFRLESGATVSGTPQLQSSGPISCGALAAGVGAGALDCTTDAAAGSITLVGPTFVSTSGAAMPLDVGYLGSDSQSFFSAVVSGAGGTYLVTLLADAGISTDLTIHAGQTVVVSGDEGLVVPPGWGAGGFEVEQFGSLALSRVRLPTVSYCRRFCSRRQDILASFLSDSRFFTLRLPFLADRGHLGDGRRHTFPGKHAAAKPGPGHRAGRLVRGRQPAGARGGDGYRAPGVGGADGDSDQWGPGRSLGGQPVDFRRHLPHLCLPEAACARLRQPVH